MPAAREPALEAAPRLTAVCRFVDPASLPALDEVPGTPGAFPGGGVEDVGIPGLEREVHETRDIVAGQDLVPGLPTVVRAVYTALATRRVEPAERCHEDTVRVPRIDQDTTDPIGILEAHVPPRVAAVVGAEHAEPAV